MSTVYLIYVASMTSLTPSRRWDRLALDDERLLLVVVPAVGAIARRVDAVAALAEEGAEQREEDGMACNPGFFTQKFCRRSTTTRVLR